MFVCSCSSDQQVQEEQLASALAAMPDKTMAADVSATLGLLTNSNAQKALEDVNSSMMLPSAMQGASGNFTGYGNTQYDSMGQMQYTPGDVLSQSGEIPQQLAISNTTTTTQDLQLHQGSGPSAFVQAQDKDRMQGDK